jgi:ankyrin repeat protein
MKLYVRAAGVIVAGLLFAVFANAASSGGDTQGRLFAALRSGNLDEARSLARTGVNFANAGGETPLMYASLYSNAEMVRFLLARGADPNAKSATGTTALMLATGDIEKVRVLIAKGADVNAKSVTGRTPLLIAASRSGAGEVVQLLLANGAAINAKDQLQGMPVIPAGGGGSTALLEAAKIRDGRGLNALLNAGADIQAKDNSGADALAAAVLHGNLENAKALLARGVKPDARVTPNQLTDLMLAAWRQDPKLVSALIAAGADVNAVDAGGNTALMWSAYSDYADPETTRILIQAGSKIDARNQKGESALTWARRRGETEIVRLLIAKGAADEARRQTPAKSVNENRSVEVSATKAIAQLQSSGPEFFKVSGCVSCHNQSIPQIATSMARKGGIHVDESIADRTQKQVLSIVKPAKLPLMEMSDVVPDVAGTVPYLLLGLAADNYPADEYTDAAVFNLLAKQFPDGSWRPWAPRPPLEFSPVTSTALAIRALKLYAPPASRGMIDARIASARQYLLDVKPRTTEEKAMRLIGLHAAGASGAAIAAASKELIAAQRADGGWSQLDTLESDAYATGQSLYALRSTKSVGANSSVYSRGANYLLSTQGDDGTWHVVTRSFPFQPYMESGYPHREDQWISATGSAWATMALMSK